MRMAWSVTGTIMVPNAAAGIDLRLETYEQSMVVCRRNKYLYLLKISPHGRRGTSGLPDTLRYPSYSRPQGGIMSWRARNDFILMPISTVSIGW